MKLQALVAASLMAGSAMADGHVDILVESAPSSLAGHTTFTLTAIAAEDGDVFIGFDFVGDGSSGFFGAMNQINPNNIKTTFNDSNAFFGFVGAEVDQDSQFPVNSGDGIAVNDAESADSLQGAFNRTGGTDFGSEFTFAQIVIPGEEIVTYNGTLTLQDAAGARELVPVEGRLVVPEPASAALIAAGTLALIRRRRSA